MRKKKAHYNKELSEKMRLEGYTSAEIAEATGCAEITCAINLKHLKVDRNFKEVYKEFVVYEVYNDEGDCIYIGQSRSFRKRWLQHRNKTHWVSEAKEFVFHVLGTSPDMAFLEAQLIILKSPKYNSDFVGDKPSNSSVKILHTIRYNIRGVKIG